MQLEHELDRVVVEVAAVLDDLDEGGQAALTRGHLGHGDGRVELPENCRKRGRRSLDRGPRDTRAYSSHRCRDGRSEDSWPSPEHRATAWVIGFTRPGWVVGLDPRLSVHSSR